MNLRLPRISAADQSGEPRLTGRAVLLMLVAFFGIVIVVNLFMVRAAISTFGGVDTPSSYEAGLEFQAEEEAAAAQNARHWLVTARLLPDSAGAKTLTVDLRDQAGKPVTGTRLEARLAHPVNERRDVTIAMAETTPGIFRGTAEVDPGQWILDLEVTKGGERLFRSQSRLIVR
jgi:nitrogen fixation protein FixH